MDFGADDSLAEWVDALLQSVLRKVATILSAEYGSIRTTGDSQFRLVAISVGTPQEGTPLTMEIRDRDASLIGMVEFQSGTTGDGFTEADRRHLRDFEKGFGLLLEMCMHTKNRAQPS